MLPMLPSQRDIEVPLLEALMELGGQARPKDTYSLITQRFNQLREEDLVESLPSGSNKWTNRIQWVRQALIARGEMDSVGHGIWRITEKGRQRVDSLSKANSRQSATSSDLAVSLPTFMELFEHYEAAFRAQVLERLQSLAPSEFEHFAQRLMRAYGFVDVNVTQLTRDGGVDGYGKLRLGLATMNVAFQCKRWQGSVGRPEVDKFRGAIQGEFEQGVFFTTSDFTPDARDASLKRGAVPIILLNGESIVSLMIEKGFGVERVPLYAYFERPGDFVEPDKV
jgi:restriction system protein